MRVMKYMNVEGNVNQYRASIWRGESFVKSTQSLGIVVRTRLVADDLERLAEVSRVAEDYNMSEVEPGKVRSNMTDVRTIS